LILRLLVGEGKSQGDRNGFGFEVERGGVLKAVLLRESGVGNSQRAGWEERRKEADLIDWTSRRPDRLDTELRLMLQSENSHGVCRPSPTLPSRRASPELISVFFTLRFSSQHPLIASVNHLTAENLHLEAGNHVEGTYERTVPPLPTPFHLTLRFDTRLCQNFPRCRVRRELSCLLAWGPLQTPKDTTRILEPLYNHRSDVQAPEIEN
jgi:hypothetical protein